MDWETKELNKTILIWKRSKLVGDSQRKQMQNLWETQAAKIPMGKAPLIITRQNEKTNKETSHHQKEAAPKTNRNAGQSGFARLGSRLHFCLLGHHWSMDMSWSKLREMVKDREAWCAAVHGVTKRQKLHSNWTTKSMLNVPLEPCLRSIYFFCGLPINEKK